MNLEGKLLGNRYEIIEKIGNGGMAVVYKAKCHVLNRFVAVKILKDEFTTDEEFIKRFQIEAQAAASITHPNIVSVFDVGVDENLHYIVMELVKGSTLKEIIVNERGPLPWKWSVNIAIQIASALEVAHKNNIVHRDIKPHNIIITEDGIAKVTDFGIAKAVSNSTITAFGTTIGSVHYFSPEHARGGYTDAKSDLYSLGIVLYEMLTNRVPFDADTPVSIALKHMQEEPVEPINLNPDIPVSVNDIIMKSLKKDPNSRYPSATDLLKDLNAALKNPEGDFVQFNSYGKDFATQKFETLNGDYGVRKDKKKENKFIGFIKKHKVLSSIIGLILLALISFGATVLAANIFTNKEVELPNLVGVSKEEAQKTVEGLNVVFQSTEEYSVDVPAGYVISQDPTYDSSYVKHIKEKSTISVIVSKGTQTTTVPKVIGETKENAITKLQTANLKYEVKEESSETVKSGVVIKQSVDANKQANAGDTITITVSTGSSKIMVTVPSLVGKTEDDAKALLDSVKLTADVQYEENNAQTEGKVFKQTPNESTSVEQGSKVTVYVYKKKTEYTGTVNVNVKSFLSDNDIYDTNTTTGSKSPKTVNVKIYVDNQSDSIYNKTVSADSTSISQQIVGTGTVSVKVIIDGNLVATKNFDLSTGTLNITK